MQLKKKEEEEEEVSFLIVTDMTSILPHTLLYSGK
jgi:hypothetical protein